MKNILVYGWYANHGNMGDNFFKDIFRALFPDYVFTFTDRLTPALLAGKDAIFFGGGSFLDQVSSASIHQSILPALLQMPLFYIGIGAETEIHPIHQQLIKVAKLIAIRSPVNLDTIQALNKETIVIPDLIYYAPEMQKETILPNPVKGSVLILPNIATLPQAHEPHWKHISWEHFKFEFAQFLDHLIEDGYSPTFFPMCLSDKLNDNWAATEILAKMEKRDGKFLQANSDCAKVASLQEAITYFSSFETIITQRYHGIVLAQLAFRPVFTIAHHDKLKNGDANSMSFYGFTWREAMKQFSSLQVKKDQTSLSINSNIFTELKEKVKALLG